MERCHGCVRKITDQNPSSTEDRWGNSLCDTCTRCVHNVRLTDFCLSCETMFRV